MILYKKYSSGGSSNTEPKEEELSLLDQMKRALGIDITPTSKKVEKEKEEEEVEEKDLTSDDIINVMIESFGGTPSKYKRLADSIAFHESKNKKATGQYEYFNPKKSQEGGGPGRGLYQFEIGKDRGGITAARRAVNLYNDAGLSVPSWLKNATKSNTLDVSTLTPDQQTILFYAYHFKGPSKLSSYIKGTINESEFWAKYHQTENDPKKIKNFDADFKKYLSWLLTQMKSTLPKKLQEGGSTLDSITTQYPAIKNMGNITLKADTSFTKDKTGVGDIEYFSPEEGRDTVTYDTGYKYPHPNPGSYGIVYNPKTNNQESIFLDLLHGMSAADPTYSKMREDFKQQTLKDREGDIKYFYKQDKENGRANDGYDAWLDNYVDGLIRSELSSDTTGGYSIERMYNSIEMKKLAEQLKSYLKQ